MAEFAASLLPPLRRKEAKNKHKHVLLKTAVRYSVIQGGAKRTHVFQIIVTLFIFNIKNYVNTKTTRNKWSFDYLN